jgi:hypothetical protein
MRLILSLLRVAVLSALVVILWAKPAVTDAQIGGTCLTFSLEESSCASCCSLHNQIDTILVSTGAGVDSIGDATLACGSSPASCEGSPCGNQTVNVPVYNGSCTTCVP